MIKKLSRLNIVLILHDIFWFQIDANRKLSLREDYDFHICI